MRTLYANSLAMDDLKPVSHLLAIDVTSEKGMKLLREGIKYLVILLLRCKNSYLDNLFLRPNYLPTLTSQILAS